MMRKPEATKFKGKGLLKGKRCMVTGGALGIGRQISYTLAESGAEVAILDCNLEAAREAQKLLSESIEDCKVHVVHGDVSNLTSLKDSFAEISSLFGGSMDVFVNNVGIIQPGRIENLVFEEDARDLDRMLDVNFKGTYYCAACAYPLLQKGVDPVFILIGSCASVGSEGQGVYAGTKAAQRGLLGTLAKEWKASDESQAVRVGLIEPDYLEKTAITENEQYWLDLAAARKTTVDKISDATVAKTKVPLKREGKLTEIAEVVMFYALSTYLSGEVIKVSGGKTIRL